MKRRTEAGDARTVDLRLQLGLRVTPSCANGPTIDLKRSARPMGVGRPLRGRCGRPCSSPTPLRKRRWGASDFSALGSVPEDLRRQLAGRPREAAALLPDDDRQSAVDRRGNRGVAGSSNAIAHERVHRFRRGDAARRTERLANSETRSRSKPSRSIVSRPMRRSSATSPPGLQRAAAGPCGRAPQASRRRTAGPCR